METKDFASISAFTGDEKKWKHWFANITTTVVLKHPELATEMKKIASRAEGIQDWDTLDDILDTDVVDKFAGAL